MLRCVDPDGCKSYCVDHCAGDEPRTRGGARPGAGRPPKAPADKASERVEVRLTPAQAAQLDADRGAESRSAYLARMAGLSGPAVTDELGAPPTTR